MWDPFTGVAMLHVQIPTPSSQGELRDFIYDIGKLFNDSVSQFLLRKTGVHVATKKPKNQNKKWPWAATVQKRMREESETKSMELNRQSLVIYYFHNCWQICKGNIWKPAWMCLDHCQCTEKKANMETSIPMWVVKCHCTSPLACGRPIQITVLTGSRQDSKGASSDLMQIKSRYQGC